MATLINNQGVQYYANKMVQADNRKVGNKSLPSVLSDIDSKIDEFKEVFDREYGSALDMKIKNNTNSFSVGTGIDIDKKSEVENSFTDIELSGNSMVNLINSKTLKEWTTAPQNELGKVVTTEEICIDWSKGINYNSWIQIRNDNSPVFSSLKPNTDYTVFVNILENNPTIGNTKYVGNVISMHLWLINGYDGIRKWIDSNMIGWTPFVYNSNNINNDINYTIFGLQPMGTNSDGTKFIDGGKFRMSKEIIVLEGDWTNKPLPSYFEGLKSVGENEENKISILSHNKNLITLEDVMKISKEFTVEKDDNGTTWVHTHNVWLQADIEEQKIYKNFKKNTSYTLTYAGITDDLEWGLRPTMYYSDGTMSYGSYSPNNSKNTVTSNSNKTLVAISLDVPWAFQKKNLKINMSVLQLEEGNKATDYIAPMQNKKEILLSEPLRGIGDIKDTIEKINGEWKIIRRCGEITLDDNLFWSLNNTENTHLNTNRFIAAYPQNKGAVAGYPFIGMCDTLPVYSAWSDTAHLGVTLGSPRTIFVYKKDCTTSTEFTRWIKENPAKVVYKLETPIIEDIDPVVLQCWKNGYISIDEVLPVETTHTVALNKPAQIKRNIEELTELRNRVKNLEEFYDQVALEQAYKLELINHSYELDYM